LLEISTVKSGLREQQSLLPQHDSATVATYKLLRQQQLRLTATPLGVHLMDAR
jgi:hypothetical protein